MLYTCGLVTVINGTTVRVSGEETWRNWLREEGLQPTNTSGISEFTKCRVEVKYLMDERCRGSEARRLEAYFLRIGEYKEKGETITPTDQLRAELPAPLVNLELRSVQRRLAQSLLPIFRKYNRFDDVAAVEAWIKWSVIDEEALLLKQMEDQMESEDKDNSSEESDSEVEELDKDAGLPTPNTNNNTTTLISTPSTVTARSVVVLTSPSVAAIQHYPPDHPNSKYPLLNSLNYNLMDRSTQSASIRSSSQMDGLVREIKQYKRDNNEEFVIESMNSRVKKLVEVPCVSASSFYKKGKE
jgi:hypothetical protein